MKNKIFDIISLFSGGGFLDIGFLNKGFQVVDAVEIEPYFIEAYNFGLDQYFKKSDNYFVRNGLVKPHIIAKPTDASDLTEQTRLRKTHRKITGLIGGPPCQDYAVGGKNGGIEGERGRLIYSYLDIVQKVQPSFLFFENVEGLYKTKRHRASFDIFVNDIESLGYTVWHDLLNVLDYGFPQDRRRIALVAFKNNIVKSLTKNGYCLEKDNNELRSGNENLVFKWPVKKYADAKGMEWPGRWDFGSKDKTFDISERSDLCVLNAFKNLSETTPNQTEFFKPKSSRFKEIEEGDTNRKSFKRLHRYKYSPTVAYGNNEVHLHPTEKRRLSVREGLRLQTVPDEYVLPAEMPLTPKFKLISNGVPPALAELVANEIRRTLVNHLSINEKH